MGTTLKLLDRVTKGWVELPSTEMKEGDRGPEVVLYKLHLKYQTPKQIVKWVVKYKLGVWEEDLKWRHKLVNFVYRMVFESTRDQDLNNGFSNIKRSEKGSSSSRGNCESRKTSVVSQKLNKVLKNTVIDYVKILMPKI